MSWAVITLTRNSLHLGLRVKEALRGNGTLYAPEKILNSYRNEIIEQEVPDDLGNPGVANTSNVFDLSNIESIYRPFKSFVKSIYKKHEGMIFIMATGIVVRSLEGLMEHKSKDPAVIVMDEKGEFIIPLLSGHLGGGNETALLLAERLKATPVITTASDVQGKIAVDMLSKKLGFVFDDFDAATRLSAKIVNDEPVTVFTEVPLPDWVEKYFSVVPCDKDQLLNKVRESIGGAIIISNRKQLRELDSTKRESIQLYPKNLIIGIGARKNISADHVQTSIKSVLQEFEYSPLSIKHFATVDVKEKEPGILEGIKAFNRPLRIISREEIKTVEGDFEGSDFVKKTLGISAVAEPAAYLSSGKKGAFIFGKRKIQGLTLALWKEKSH